MYPASPFIPPRYAVCCSSFDDHPILRGGLTHSWAASPTYRRGPRGKRGAGARGVAGSLTTWRPGHFLARRERHRHCSEDIRNPLAETVGDGVLMHDEMLYAERVLYCGARGYLMKSETPACILAAVRRVLAGHLYMSEAVNSRILVRLVDGGASGVGGNASSSGSPMLDRLSNRGAGGFPIHRPGARHARDRGGDA